MKQKIKIELALVVSAIVLVSILVALLPYFSPESIQITPVKGTLNSQPSLLFIVTGHLNTRQATIPIEFQVINLGYARFSGQNYITTDFFGNFNYTLPQSAPFQNGTSVELKVSINETGKVLQQNLNLIY
jgi:hypothetical protein